MATPRILSRAIPRPQLAGSIDGVLVRGVDPLPRAHEALSYLQSQRIPFILLTNGGGKPESRRVVGLSRELDVQIDESMFIQSSTPFSEMEQYKDKTVLILGGDRDNCREVAWRYGYKNVVLPVDIIVQHPEVWPFSQQYLDMYQEFSKPLPKPISTDPSQSLKIDAIFVYHDPRDWGLDAAIILDVLLSHKGILGTLSPLNNRGDLPNRGYQQDGQPPLYFSNGDMWWPGKFHLPRLGQGGFREAFQGLWEATTGGEKAGVKLHKTVIGKPTHLTYVFAEKRLNVHRKQFFEGQDIGDLKTVYMVGDNPESDIRGANEFQSPAGTKWKSLLVSTGVYQGGEPTYPPTQYVEDVLDAVQWGVKDSAWDK